MPTRLQNKIICKGCRRNKTFVLRLIPRQPSILNHLSIKINICRLTAVSIQFFRTEEGCWSSETKAVGRWFQFLPCGGKLIGLGARLQVFQFQSAPSMRKETSFSF
ncbi:hypothetical protein CLOHYLEM_04913 [[Clostridium] hylemonae DSM 15053]|uniref:Uncharacterized protein n=1 Tax=[Clostridium] hylemonae DSM 15053 TaxID=553973 RepID=C0BYM4_9FIRM|nr:hypothetical protein CLOHYLEM_04913 [[Clostridium] hylemonae DSM 15053]